MQRTDSLLVEAEAFEDFGGWTLDTEFVGGMGSPYLMAHGVGVPVEDAVATVRFPATGRWRVWVRTLDWVARWGADGAPGRFRLLVNGRLLPAEFGAEGAEWHWQDGGTVDIAQERTVLALRDATGFNGRCDAIFFTRDVEAGPPPNESAPMGEWRRGMLGTAAAEESAGEFDLAVAGGGYAGMCAALAAARAGLRVALIQDRPVLGGNASSEIRVPLRGLVPEGGPCPGLGRFVKELQHEDSSLADKPAKEADAKRERIVGSEGNIALLLNHCLYGAETDGDRILAAKALDVRRGVTKTVRARLFADCTGHATLGALAGAEHVIGVCEGSAFRPSREYSLLGMTIKRFWDIADMPSAFPETPWALDLTMDDFPTSHLTKTAMWESGFYRHPINDLEYIRDWNLRALYGSWDAVKNKDKSGQHAHARILFLGAIGGPRESRRLVGDYVLHEDDMLRRVSFDDGFVPVTWYLDRHFPLEQCLAKFPDDPFVAYATHKPGTAREDRPRHGAPWWGIPYRCLYSRNIENLFMAGRNISTSYWALGAVRVMRTCGMMGEVVGNAAAICAEHDCTPRAVYHRYLERLKRAVG